MTGFGVPISNLKRLLAKALMSCWSILMDLMFWLERVFWQIKRSQLIAHIGQGFTMLKSVAHHCQRTAVGLLSTSHLEDITGSNFYNSASKPDLDHLENTKPFFTLTQGPAELGANGKGLKNVWSNLICANWWRNWFNRQSLVQRYRHIRGGAKEERQSFGIRARVEAARQTGCSEDR